LVIFHQYLLLETTPKAGTLKKEVYLV